MILIKTVSTYSIVEGFNANSSYDVPNHDLTIMSSTQQDPLINRIQLQHKHLILMTLPAAYDTVTRNQMLSNSAFKH